MLLKITLLLSTYLMSILQGKAQSAWKPFQINMEYKEVKMFIHGKREAAN